MLNLIHFINLGAPFVELLGQNVYDTITINMAKMILNTDLTQIAIVLDTEVCPVFFVVITVAVISWLEIRIFIIVGSQTAAATMVNPVNAM